MDKGKIIIFSAPSGSGKTTIIKQVLKNTEFMLEFSVSACSRPKRGNEIDGKDYYFFSVDEFKKKIDNNEFLEWEEVYDNQFYGSLKSEVERITKKGKNVVFDIDVKGALNIKKYYQDKALSIFILPPSIQVLEDRLKKRSTDSKEQIKKRIERAKFEISYSDKFDKQVINDKLEDSVNETKKIIKTFLNN